MNEDNSFTVRANRFLRSPNGVAYLDLACVERALIAGLNRRHADEAAAW